MFRTLFHIGPFLPKQWPLSQSQVRLFRSTKKRVRKPFWMPKAPSKLFVLAKHPVVSPAEEKQFQMLVKSYNDEMKSIIEYFKNEQRRIEEEKGEFSKVTIHEEQVFEDQLKAVEEDNKRIALKRQVEHEEAFQKRMALLLEKSEKIEERKRVEEKEAREIFNKEMENFHCITRETLDAAIEKAIDKQSSYNFAVTATGDSIYQKADLHVEEK